MGTLLVILHIVISVLLIVVVLLQQNRGGLSGVFGGSVTQSVFGGRGAAPVLTKIATVLGVLFFISSFSLAVYFTKGKQGRVIRRPIAPQPMEQAPVEEPITQPVEVPSGVSE